MFYFNEFAFTVQVKHKINRPSIQILGFILICLYFTTGRFHTCVLCKECSLFAFSWLSFQRLCRLLCGLQSVDNTLQSAVPLERYPIGTKAQQNENMCPIRSKKAFVLTGFRSDGPTPDILRQWCAVAVTSSPWLFVWKRLQLLNTELIPGKTSRPVCRLIPRSKDVRVSRTKTQAYLLWEARITDQCRDQNMAAIESSSPISAWPRRA